MSVAAGKSLDRAALPWLFASALAATLPHVGHLPPWLSISAGLILAWGSWLVWRGQRLPGRWPLALLVLAASAGIMLEYHTLLGREAGIATLLLFMAMKLLELRQRRDAYVVIHLGYFLLLTHYFYSQSIPTGLWLFAAMVILTGTLIRLHGAPGAASPWVVLRYAGLMVLQAIPFMLVFYLFFPRLVGPLWGVPQGGRAGSGLSEQMTPGSIAELALNSDIAFRVRFDGPAPPQHLLYWRGPVLEDFDGRVWRQRLSPGQAPLIEPLARPIAYEITLEAHQQRWLLALDAPTAVPEGSGLSPALVLMAREPVSQRQRHRLAAALAYRYNAGESEMVRQRLTRLPPGDNPRTRALAEEWRRNDAEPERLVRRALDYFRREAFVYTLQPPLLEANPIDDFLFTTRRGFCEHYAAAFVVLMRAAGVPARVVTGYQGGDRNPVDGYIAVRQSDAHAWAEVWLAGRGWVRVDPTAAVSPSRVEAGLAASLPSELTPGLIRLDAGWMRGLRYRWEAVNNAWNQWVLGYNPQRQRELLSRMGLPDPDWRTFATLLLGAAGSALALVASWALYRRPRADPAQRLWQKAQRRLRRHRVRCQPWEAPLAFAERVAEDHPELGYAVREIASAYCNARYAQSARPENLRALRLAVARLS